MTAARRQRVCSALTEKDIAGLLVTSMVNVRYLTGFTGSNAVLLLPVEGEPTLFTDGRYREQVVREVPDLPHVITRKLLVSATEKLSGTWAIESHAVTVDQHHMLREAAPTVTFVGGERIVERFREVKDETEIAALRKACRISVEALEAVWAGPLLGRSEREIARDLEFRMLRLGAEAVGFETIAASGPNSAIPHHAPTDRVVEYGDYLKIDFGARVDGYHADCTRTAVVGRAHDWQKEIYAVVRQAQAAGVQALVPDASVADVNQLVRDFLEQAGWLERFTTGLGHGVGLQIHEDPFFGDARTGRLSRRTVLTMEPGIYVPGRGGVRIEDTVLVTSDAPEVLTPASTDLLEIL